MGKRIPKPFVGCSSHPRASRDRSKRPASVSEKPLASEFYKKQKALGLCARCSEKSLPNRVLCQKHYEKSRAYSAKVSAALKLYKAVQNGGLA